MVSAREFFLDHNGIDWPISLTTAVALGLPAKAEALIDVCVDGHGWAAVRQQASWLWIRCRPGMISEKCLAKLSALIRKSKQRKRILDIPSEGKAPSYKKAFTCRRSADHVLRAMVIGRQSKSNTSFETQAQVLRPIHRTLIAHAFIAGREISSIHKLSNALDKIVKHPWLLWRHDTSEHQSVCVALSGKYMPFNPGWYDNAIGSSADEFAGPEYGLLVSQGHNHAIQSSNSICDLIKAHVNLKDTGPTALDFSRLLVPIVRPDGERLVLSTPRPGAVAPMIRSQKLR